MSAFEQCLHMVTVTIKTDLELDDVECKELRELLGCTQVQLGDRLAGLVAAAAHEYVDMFTGVAPVTTASDTRERRLASIILRGDGGIPTPAQVARLFSITPASASTLIRNVRAKHRLRLEAAFNKTLFAIVDGAAKSDDRYYAVIRNPALVKLLNDILVQADDPQTPVRLADDSLSRYIIDPGSRKVLLAALKPAGTDGA